MSLKGWTKFLNRIEVVLTICVLSVLSSSCKDITQAESKSTTSRNSTEYGQGQALVYLDNPTILRGSYSYAYPSWGSSLVPALITSNFYLNEKCTFNDVSIPYTTDQNCIEVRNDKADTTLIQKTNDSWGYETNSDEFYQVNTFYHAKKIQSRFLDSLSFAHNYVHRQGSLNLPPALPANPGRVNAFWWSENPGITSTLKIFSRCYLEDMNSYFDPANFELCLGWNDEKYAGFRMAQDPTVIYHEFGHALVKIMMNIRNTFRDVYDSNITKSTDFKSELGELAYDEAGALNEGIADYFSYYITQRAHIGEWAMAKFQSDRPMTETDVLHQSRIPAKLSYPEYLHYNAVNPEDGFEDIHLAGQIVSHYLVSLTEKLKTSCSFPSTINTSEKIHKRASDYVVLLLSETFAEIGDMTAKGSDYFSQFSLFNPSLEKIFFTNLNNEESFLWAHQVTPPNFRRFFRIFGKNIKYYLSDNFYGLCPNFNVDSSEKLLDDYGLLLFKSYKDAGQGNNSTTGASLSYQDYDNTYLLGMNPFSANTTSSSVNELNRKNTVLVSKDYIQLPTDSTRATAYVFDTQTYMANYLAQLTFEGKPVNLSEGLAGTNYNNGNVKISPGEVVGLSLNLVNNSNSTMSGVQILANDWDHMRLKDSSKTYVNSNRNMMNHSDDIAIWEPCQLDGWPLITEGGTAWTPVVPPAQPTQGGCEYITKDNKKLNITNIGTVATPVYETQYVPDSPQPICMVQYSDDNESKWTSQDFYRKYELDLEDKDCLNNAPTGTGYGVDFNPNECLVRVLPGANQAVLGKIDPQKTWSETLASSTEDGQVKFLSSTLVVMEINKWIKPGTKFNCRFRVRFSNCQDCYNENNSGEDYNDYEYAGHEPYKVINFSFTVID